jgi:CIC family chloride channel protein
VVGGVSSLVMVKLIGSLRPRLKALPRWTQYFQPAAAGLLIGVIGLGFPQVLGAGYEYIDQVMHDQYPWRILALLGAFKIVATSLSFVSGTPGGMFAPTLFIGAMIGGAVGGVEHHFFPFLTGSVGAYALVGMGTLFAGFLRVPFTSVFMVLEVSGNYSIILPVMISNTISYLISRRFQSTALFDLLSRQDGIDLPSMEERREEAVLRVENALRPYQGPILRGSESIAEVLKSPGGPHFLVSEGAGEWAIVSRPNLESLADLGQENSTIRSVLPPEPLPHVHPDQPLDVALRRLGEWPLLPVLNRADSSKLEGVVTLQTILETYRAGRRNLQ